jgi:hypothetical protein
MKMDSVKMTVRVMIEKDIDVELTPALFDGMTHAEYLAEFRKGLWHVSGMDDVVKYAARCAANGGIGMEHDGLGLMSDPDANNLAKGNVLAREIQETCVCEILRDEIQGEKK